MSKEQLYTAIESVHERGKAIVDELKGLEQDLADGTITQEVFDMLVTEVRDMKTLASLVGEDLVIADVITVCNILLSNS